MRVVSRGMSIREAEGLSHGLAPSYELGPSYEPGLSSELRVKAVASQDGA